MKAHVAKGNPVQDRTLKLPAAIVGRGRFVSRIMVMAGDYLKMAVCLLGILFIGSLLHVIFFLCR